MAQLTIEQTFDLALQHHTAGRFKEAEQLYQQVLVQQPSHVDAMHLLGVIAHQAGRNDVAVDLIRRAIALKPNFPEAHANLGNALKDRGQLDEAIAAYRQAIALNPNFAGAFSNLGNALKDKGQLDESIAACRKAISLRPDYPEALNNLGNALRDKGQLDESIAACRQAIAIRPNFAEAHNNLGNALKDKGQLDEAIAACRRAIALKPDFPEALTNLAIALKRKGELEESITAYRRAVAIRPNYAEARSNLGNALYDVGRLDEAIAAFRQALTLRPQYAEAHHNLSFALLARGDFLPGWEEYEWRWKCKDFPSPARNFAQPIWDGSPLKNRSILLHAEQGFGDAIQFVRYVPLVIQRGGRIIIECQAELERLFRTAADGLQIVVCGQPLPEFDLHCPLLSLPRVFGTTLANIPNNVPYLNPEPALVDAWSRTLGRGDGKLRVGLAWGGSPQFQADRTRSLNLEQLAPLAQIRGIEFHSLQKGAPGEQAKNPPPGMQLIDLGSELNDFADTAAVMTLMDLIVTTDTSVPHLAGALGRPVWVMLQFAPDFRWLQDREDSPWYPTMRLFRQPSKGDWDSVIARVADALRSLAKK